MSDLNIEIPSYIIGFKCDIDFTKLIEDSKYPVTQKNRIKTLLENKGIQFFLGNQIKVEVLKMLFDVHVN
jgi:hypothetical protein